MTAKGTQGRERAAEQERRRFRAGLLDMARSGKTHAAVTLALCLGHEDLIPQLKEARP